MNAGRDGAVTTFMTDKPALTPKEKEIQSLFARGKTPEHISIRLGMKLSKVLLVIAMVPKALV
jgi:DNA-binding CsgD family transcriptional regulator